MMDDSKKQKEGTNYDFKKKKRKEEEKRKEKIWRGDKRIK